MGTGTSSGKTAAAAVQNTSVAKAIKKIKYTDNGNGTWSFDIEGVGGVQVLDETGGSRDPNLGRGGKYYGVNVWDKNYTSSGPTQYISGSIYQAKQLGKELLKKLNNA